MRSSQPLSGPHDYRCKEDEKLMSAAVFDRKRCYIVDTRSANYAANVKSKGVYGKSIDTNNGNL